MRAVINWLFGVTATFVLASAMINEQATSKMLRTSRLMRGDGLFCLVRLLRKRFVVVLVASFGVFCQRAQAQSPGGFISVFADPSASSCMLLDEEPALFDVYIVHTAIPYLWGVVGSQFKLIQGPGFDASYVSESIAVPVHSGSVMSGISLVYEGCYVLETLLLATVTFQGYGTSTPCSYLDVGGHPAVGGTTAITQNCFFDLHLAPSVEKFYVNPEARQCQPWCVVPTQTTTWGGVKALYRE